MKDKDSLQLNKKDDQIYKFANFIFFLLFTFFVIYMLFRVIFPSQFFTFSFANINSLKNTITDVNRLENRLDFYASTPLSFSQLKINIELSTATSDLDNQKIEVKKSYKSFFYPETTSLINLENKEENNLVSIDDSVFIVGNKTKTPIDSTTTFESLGYNWSNLKKNTADLSNYEKQKLADLNAAHPTGTILQTTENSNYYFIENFTKKKIINPDINSIKNSIAVEEKSLNQFELCYLKRSNIFNKQYSCTVPLSKIAGFIGKDYLFTINNFSADIKLKKIDLEFEKSITQENFRFFLGELKKKILYRFGFKDE